MELPTTTAISKVRGAIALFSGIALCILFISPFVIAIRHFDWGVGLLLLAPLLVWGLMRMARALEGWARKPSAVAAPDPDFPE